VSCARCRELEKEVKSLNKWIVSHQDAGMRLIDQNRAMRKELAALRLENETLRTGRPVPKKSRKKSPLGAGTE
jgi:hypothetical protein